MLVRALFPYATLVRAICEVNRLERKKTEANSAWRFQPLTTVMVMDNVTKCLNIARDMSTAGIDYANILHSKFRNIFYFL